MLNGSSSVGSVGDSNNSMFSSHAYACSGVAPIIKLPNSGYKQCTSEFLPGWFELVARTLQISLLLLYRGRDPRKNAGVNFQPGVKMHRWVKRFSLASHLYMKTMHRAASVLIQI